MRRAVFGGLAALALAAAPAAAAPIPYLSAHQEGDQIVGTFQASSQEGTRCKVNAFAALMRNGEIVNRTGRYSFDGCANDGDGEVVSFHLRVRVTGRYQACIAAFNNDRLGRTLRHARCVGVTVR
jgi:hypothetical protein